jgi:hypothetical protein
MDPQQQQHEQQQHQYQAVEQAAERAGARPGNGEARGAALETAGVSAALASVVAPAPARGRAPGKRGSGKRTGTPNQAPAADAQPTVNLSLPKEVYEYFQRQADADERTLAKYLQRLVRQEYQRLNGQEAETATT